MTTERLTKEEYLEVLNQEDKEQLQERANALGVEFRNNMKEDTIRNLILNNVYPEDEEEVKVTQKEDAAPLTKKERLAAKRAKVRADATQLVRVLITCMNPAKQDWDGEYFTVSNSAIPTIKRLVPFGIEWHIERIILNQIVDRKYAQQIVKKVNGFDVNSTRDVPEFKIMELDPLTPQELKELAADQAARNAIE